MNLGFSDLQRGRMKGSRTSVRLRDVAHFENGSLTGSTLSRILYRIHCRPAFGRKFSFLSVAHTRIASSAALHPSEASFLLISKYSSLNRPHPSRSTEPNSV